MTDTATSKKRHPEVRWLPTRLALFSRGDGRCVYCSTPLHHSDFELDHCVAVARGGPHTATNLVVACHRCNAAKGSKPLAVWIRQTAYEQAEQMAPYIAPAGCGAEEYLSGVEGLAEQIATKIATRVRRQRERVLPRAAGRLLARLVRPVAA